MDGIKILDNVISNVEKNTKKPENFLSVQTAVAEGLKVPIKSLYDFTKERSKRKTDALPELVTEGFDDEQVWQQLELQNEGEWSHFLTAVSRILAKKHELVLPVTHVQQEVQQKLEESAEESVSEAEENMSVDSHESNDEDDESTETSRKKKKKIQRDSRKKVQKTSVVDDKFFKLQELDEYLTKEDKKAVKDAVVKTGDDDSDDEESVDLFEDYSDDDYEVDDTESARFSKYADFFDSPESGEEVMNSGDENLDDRDDDPASRDLNQPLKQLKDRRVQFNLADDSDDDGSSEIVEQIPADQSTEVKSSLEARQDRLQSRIQELEKQAISDKPWQLKGEVDAASRPQNSLLQEHVEFDITTRPAPVITEQTTLKLEDIIRQRMKDKAWDDVEKKFKPVETPMEYKKKLILDQEKSKLSLAQIYEAEYVKQKEALDPENEEREVEEPKEHIEIRELMHSLFSKLDALSNFHYTPKMAKPDIKIISNVPAISMEEVAPVATSDAALLAPEEVQAKSRGDLIGKKERTETDKKRERRQKKMRQRERQKARENRDKIVNKLNPGLGNKYSKEKTAKMIDKLSKGRNVSKMEENSTKATKSSTAFFNQLQDQVKTHIKTKTGTTSKKKDRNSLSAVKLKL